MVFTQAVLFVNRLCKWSYKCPSSTFGQEQLLTSCAVTVQWWRPFFPKYKGGGFDLGFFVEEAPKG